jgi:enoyl-CoA hydratase/carnithine racemase
VSSTAKELAAMPPEALRQTKRLFYALDDVGFADGIAQAVRVNVEARSTKEFRDGVRRFAPRPDRP